MLVIFTILHRLLCHIWLILLAGIYGGISMGWNVKHPTKWVSYRLLYKTFWVSPSLEAWLKWLHGFSIFFGSKVKVFAALLSGGSKMLFRGCVERVNIWEWGYGEGWESHPWGKSDQPLMKSTGPWWWLEAWGPTELLQEEEEWRERGVHGKGLRKPHESLLRWWVGEYETADGKKRLSSCKAKSLGPSVGK